MPIGRPISNVRTYVLGSDDRVSPVRVWGELCLSGAGLARGYLRRPDSTALAFTPDPYASEPGARMYRTGDLAYYSSDGNLEFVGRRDTQVKLRGFRIELGEIEAALNSHPSIRESAVVVQRRASADPRIVGFVVYNDGESRPSADDLRRFLQQRLPNYMLPSNIVNRESLPLSRSGKLDRGRLEREEVEFPAAFSHHVPPRTPTEEALSTLWASVLGVERVGVEDDFFELGGHSILAAKLIARVRDMFEVQVPLGAIFNSVSTVAGMAQVIDRLLTENVVGASSDELRAS